MECLSPRPEEYQNRNGKNGHRWNAALGKITSIFDFILHSSSSIHSVQKRNEHWRDIDNINNNNNTNNNNCDDCTRAWEIARLFIAIWKESVKVKVENVVGLGFIFQVREVLFSMQECLFSLLRNGCHVSSIIE